MLSAKHVTTPVKTFHIYVPVNAPPPADSCVNRGSTKNVKDLSDRAVDMYQTGPLTAP